MFTYDDTVFVYFFSAVPSEIRVLFSCDRGDAGTPVAAAAAAVMSEDYSIAATAAGNVAK